MTAGVNQLLKSEKAFYKNRYFILAGCDSGFLFLQHFPLKCKYILCFWKVLGTYNKEQVKKDDFYNESVLLAGITDFLSAAEADCLAVIVCDNLRIKRGGQ